MSTINDQKGLMVRFKLDESSGTTAKDSSGNSRHGTLGNFTNTTTCWTHEKRDGGLDFGQATTAKCDFAFTDPGDFTTMMAFVAWDTESAFPRVIHLGDNDVPYQLLYLDHAGGDTGNALASVSASVGALHGFRPMQILLRPPDCGTITQLLMMLLVDLIILFFILMENLQST